MNVWSLVFIIIVYHISKAIPEPNRGRVFHEQFDSV